MINPATTWLRCPEQRSFTPWEASFEFKRQEAEMVPSKAPSPMCTLSETANLPLTTCRALPRHPWAGRKCPKGNKPECGEGRTAAVLRPRLSSVSSGRFLDNLRRWAHRTMRWSGQKKKKMGDSRGGMLLIVELTEWLLSASYCHLACMVTSSWPSNCFVSPVLFKNWISC